MQTKSLLNNEDGSVIVLALIFLVLLTVLGMSATSTSTIEVQIAGNGAQAKKNLYLAEAAAMDAVQQMEDGVEAQLKPANIGAGAFPFLNDDLGDIADPSTDIPNMPDSEISDPITGTSPRYAAVARGITGPTSLGMTAPSQMFTFDVYGIFEGNGKAQVVVGYRKRF